MVMCATNLIVFFCLLSVTFADRERRWATPARLTSAQPNGKSNHANDSIQPRFLPFSASFSLSSGGLANNAHSLSVGGGNEGISFSQSTSQSGASIGNGGSGISASQSSSFAAGLSGISGADSNSFNLNHPAFGGNAQANSNSFALGQANSAAHGNVANGQATSGAQSTVGSSHSLASSGASSTAGVVNSGGQDFRRDRPTVTNVAPNYQAGGLYNPNGGRRRLHVSQGTRCCLQRLPARGPIRLDVSLDNDRWQRRHPEVVISGYRGNRQGVTDPQKNLSFDQEVRGPSGREDAWTQTPLTGPNPGTWSQSRPDSSQHGLQISGASASSSASSDSLGGSAQGHSSSHSSFGPNGPSSWTNNRVQTSGNGQSQAQGGAASIAHNFNGNTQGSFSSAAVAGNSQGNGDSHGNAASSNRGQNSRGQVNNQGTGISFAQGTANAGSINHVKFPDTEDRHNLPKEFVRIASSDSRNDQAKRKSRTRDPLGEIFTDITDTVADIFDV